MIFNLMFSVGVEMSTLRAISLVVTRPDTRQNSRGRLGRGCNNRCNNRSEFNKIRNVPTDTARCRVACPRQRIRKRRDKDFVQCKITVQISDMIDIDCTTPLQLLQCTQLYQYPFRNLPFRLHVLK